MSHHHEINPHFCPQHHEPHPPSGMTPPQSQDQIHPTSPWIWPPTQRPTIPPPKVDPMGQWGALVPHGSAPKTQSTRLQAQEPAPRFPPQYTGAQAAQPPKHQRHGRQQRGLIVLIVYLVFRPHGPSFEVSSVTLNAAYLDVDVLLNADLTVLAKFINPNKKVRVDFNYVVLDLYYGNTLIASQYVEHFRAERRQTKLASVHMVASQVQLPSDETERLKREIERNHTEFQVKGVFRAQSNLESFVRYSYRLYRLCTIVVTNPPGGVLKAVKCKSKR
ncbi:uncharacterized protein LOC116143440 [Pistacia vera]|uniref:uncharacterized protein LOC116143440 n=1 Tax=Pistacia vera TaxID=55513 RepID=UPI00126371B2|nr:uncharacterized protein LOC116143440 [Pistacia vera]